MIMSCAARGVKKVGQHCCTVSDGRMSARRPVPNDQETERTQGHCFSVEILCPPSLLLPCVFFIVSDSYYALFFDGNNRLFRDGSLIASTTHHSCRSLLQTKSTVAAEAALALSLLLVATVAEIAETGCSESQVNRFHYFDTLYLISVCKTVEVPRILRFVLLMCSLRPLLSSLWVSCTGSASDWCALQEQLYKCTDTIQYNTSGSLARTHFGKELPPTLNEKLSYIRHENLE